MNIITLDFETMFSDEYSLSKMSTEAYVRDSRFEAHGCAIKWDAYPDAKVQGAIWYEEPLRDYLMQIDWSNTGLLCHHAHFDGLILSHHYGIVPKAYLCTLSMARLLLGNHVSASLDSVREHFDMPLKRTPYNLFKGKHWFEMDDPLRQEIATGACDEVESIWTIFNRFMQGL